MPKDIRITYTTDDDAMRGDVEVIVNKIVSMTTRNDAMRFIHTIDEGQGELILGAASGDTLEYVADLIHNVLVYMVDNVVTANRS